MRYPAYPRYKPSGVECLGDVPEHWTVSRSDPMVTSAKCQIPPEAFADAEVLHYSIPVVQACGTGAVENGEEIASAKQLIDGAVVLVSRLNPRKATICLATPHDELVTLASTEFVALKPTTGDIRFLEYLMSSELFRQRLDSWVQSVTRSHQRARPEEIYRFWSAWPEPDEQRVIAGVLDRETAKMDTLVAKKRTLIERLKEKRTALISRAVTRGLPPDAARAAGLDPHPRLKPSGVDWLGDVPAHWEVKPLGRLVHFAGGATPDKGKPEYWDGDIPWVSPKDMKRMRIDDASDHVSSEGLSNSPLTLLPANSVLIVVRGMILAHSFPVAITDAPVTINQDMKALAVGNRLDPEFLLWLLMGIARVFVALADESAHGTRKLESEIVARVCLTVPPTSEQVAITTFLDREAAKIDTMVAKVETAIERLQEYRTALITAAVTGKIDVRGAERRESTFDAKPERMEA